MLQSKLKTTYKMAEPKDWLIGYNEQIDPIFAGRLAYIAKYNNVKLKLTEGYRSSERQKELYAQFKAGKLKSAAKPGTSWHEFRLAVDTSTYPIRGMKNAQLAQYGLCKPISYEGWHIQPLETLGQTNRLKFAPKEVEDLTEAEVKAIATEVVNQILKGNGDTPSAWAKESWEKAKKQGITDGTKPQGIVTREQAIIMLERAK